MAGDQVTASVQYYYQSGETGTNPDIVTPLLSSLLSTITNGTATTGELARNGGSGITTNLGGTSGFVTSVEPNNNTTGTPQAYLTVLFFDERFNFISSADGGVSYQQVASTWTTSTSPLGLTNIKAPKNGYVLIYVSNRSQQDVFFDNLAVNITTSNIIEEDHYYTFGLKIAALSSHKIQDINEGKMSNPYQYNDKEMLDEDMGLNWYDYGFRNYDPQIGRFVQNDPMMDDYPFLSGYQYAGDDPITNVDEDGLDISGAIVSTLEDGGHDFTYATGAVNSMKGFIFPAMRATSATTRVVDLTHFLLNLSSILIHGAQIASEAINTSVLSNQAGITQGNPYLEGFRDAIINANTFGTHDLIANLFGNDPLDDYDNDYDREQYLKGRIYGDALAIAQSVSEVDAGGTAAGGGLATGPGAAVISTGGLLVMAHGGAVGAAATYDAAWATAEKIKLDLKLKASSSRTNEHHSDPIFAGGEKKQETTTMKESEHRNLHDDLNKFLVKFRNNAGKHMRPQRGNSGRIIRRNFTRKQLLKVISDFYKGPGSKYTNAAIDFFKQHPTLK
jgi:RHS repeat-associated protein